MRTLKNILPGEVLKEEFLAPMGISVYRLSKETGLSQTRLSQIIRGERGISAETALNSANFSKCRLNSGLTFKHSMTLKRLRNL